MWIELRLAARQLTGSLSFTLAAILLFAISIGGATFIFSVVKALLFAPIPYPDSRNLVG